MGRCRVLTSTKRFYTEEEPEEPEITMNKERTRTEKTVRFGRYPAYAIPFRRHPVSAVPFGRCLVLAVTFGRYRELAVLFGGIDSWRFFMAVSRGGGTFLTEAL